MLVKCWQMLAEGCSVRNHAIGKMFAKGIPRASKALRRPQNADLMPWSRHRWQNVGKMLAKMLAECLQMWAKCWQNDIWRWPLQVLAYGQASSWRSQGFGNLHWFCVCLIFIGGRHRRRPTRLSRLHIGERLDCRL